MCPLKIAVLTLLSASFSFAQTPSGWKVIHDKTNACQISVPPDWKISSMPGSADAPKDQGDVAVVARPGKTVKPMNDMAQKAMMVYKMISNTPQSVFWASQPTKSDNPITPYQAMAPGKDGMCAAIFSARKGVTEDLVTKMVATLSAVH